MFVLTRNKGNEVETLKDSSSQFNKIFDLYTEAELLAKKLNRHITQPPLWTVTKFNRQKTSLL